MPDLCPVCKQPWKPDKDMVIVDGMLFWKGRHVKFPKTINEIFHYLLSRRGHLVSAIEIYDHIYLGKTGDGPQERIIFRQISILRDAFRSYQLPFVIETVYGQGYVFKRSPDNS